MLTSLIILLNVIVLNTARTSLVLDAPENGELGILYYGSRLPDMDPASFAAAGYKPEKAYPAYGLLSGSGEYALSIVQPDGNLTLDLALCDMTRTVSEHGEEIVVVSRDRHYPIEVKNHFRTYVEEDMVEMWSEIANLGRKPVMMTRYFSGTLPVRTGDVWVSSLYGGWSYEGTVLSEPLNRGLKVIRNTDGLRNSQSSHGEVMISLDGKPRENEGRVIGAALCWPGNYELRFSTGHGSNHIFLAGISPDNARYHLDSKEVFATPKLACSYSDEGMSGVSRNFHSWGRRYMMAHGDSERKILLNSWEGVHLDVNEATIAGMMKEFADMGGELFVLDDGWFGSKYARVKPDSSLGDWVVDRNKLPGGFASLIKTAGRYGLDFGIWIEPEMTNTASELYERHPEWVLKVPERDFVYGRGGTQMILDMTRSDVREFVFSVVDGLLSENPEIDYIKWDCNMEAGAYMSTNLEHPEHLQMEYWRGMTSVLDRIREKYPDVTMQACAAGGGRINWGILPWFDEVWVSDNTDALQRIYQQWGTSYFFPAMTLGSHVSAVPNKATQRTTSLKYRIDVAMSGRFGMEMQPREMTGNEKEMCRKAISEYKQIRRIVQLGDMYRLVSPYGDSPLASLMYVSEDKSEAAFFWYKVINMQGVKLPRVLMRGLDPDRFYRIKELNRVDIVPLSCEDKVFSGRFLMESGLEFPLKNIVNPEDKSEWSSRVLYLQAMP